MSRSTNSQLAQRELSQGLSGGSFKSGLDSNTIKTISTLLSNIVSQNATCSAAAPTLGDEIFASVWPYSWATVNEYMDRLKDWIVCGPESFVVALCLLKRLEAAHAIPPINQTSVHRLFFTTLVLAVKMTEDETLCNPDFAKVGCVAPRELFYMELHCLKSLNFTCLVSCEEFAQCCQELRQVETQIQKKSQLPVLRHQPNPLTICETIFQLSPQATPPPVEGGLTRRMSLFNLRRKTSRLSLTSPSKTAESNSSKPDLSTRRVAGNTTPKQSAAIPTTPKQSSCGTPKLTRTQAIVNTPKKVAPTTPKQITTAPRQIMKSVSMFGITRRKQSVQEPAQAITPKAQAITPKAQAGNLKSILTPHRATPRLLLRQDSI